MKFLKYSIVAVAALCVATGVISCDQKLKNIDSGQLKEAPAQVVENMNASQTKNGQKEIRMFAPLMERYDKNSEGVAYEDFPKGFNVYGYNEEGFLETQISSDKARHTTTGNDGAEKWAAYGNVVIINHIKRETITTDTVYWDRQNQLIWTDCYVRMVSPQGLMQGYGLKSDEMARNAQLLRPFNSFGIVIEDSTRVEPVDSINFIGPLLP